VDWHGFDANPDPDVDRHQIEIRIQFGIVIKKIPIHTTGENWIFVH
jgi:hypothetical protein